MKRTDRSFPHVLLVNPWIHDFAAYDVWAAPLGLLLLGALLRKAGASVAYIDCLDRFHPRGPRTDPARRCGRGPYLKTKIPTPRGLEDVPRTFCRYGIPPAWFREELERMRKPDVILVSSMMTYWYPGVQETIRMLRTAFGATPIVLGGIYATLCRDHAEQHAGADKVITGTCERRILETLSEITGTCLSTAVDTEDLDALPYPALDLQRHIPFVPLLTARGCPFSCPYCAAHFLSPRHRTRRPENVVEEIMFWHRRYGVRDVAFYDDALLVDPERHAIPLLEGLVARGMPLRFHTPNALHVRHITPTVAGLMARAGFHTVRLGLETARLPGDPDWDNKTTLEEFRQVAATLLAAGFRKEQVGAYLLYGLPQQPFAALEQAIRTVKDCGLTPVPTYYTPIAHTRMWPAAVAAARYDLSADPIYTNNALWPCVRGGYQWERLTRIKKLVSA